MRSLTFRGRLVSCGTYQSRVKDQKWFQKEGVWALRRLGLQGLQRNLELDRRTVRVMLVFITPFCGTTRDARPTS